MVTSEPAAASPTVLSPGTVVPIPTPAVTMVPGGPIRGPDVAGVVTGATWLRTTLTAGHRTYSAPHGSWLVAFGLQLTQPVADVGPMAPGWAAISVFVEASGQRWLVDVGPIDRQIEASSATTGTGQATYAFSWTPRGAPPVLTIVDDGITAQYDLSAMQTLGTDTLDRIGTTPEAVVTPGTTTTVPLTDADGFTQPATVTLGWATVGPFASDDPGPPPGLQPAGAGPPDGFAPSPVQPAPSNEDVLDVALSAQRPSSTPGQPDWGHYLASLQPLPGTAVTFTPSGGTPITGQLVDTVAPADQTGSGNDDGMLDAIYRFDVSVLTGPGTLTIGPATTTGTEFTGFEGNGPSQITVGGPATLSLTLPALQPTPHHRLPWLIGDQHGTLDRPVPGPQGPSTADIGRVIAVLGGVVILALAVVVVVRRRRSRREHSGGTAGQEPAGAPPTGLGPTPPAPHGVEVDPASDPDPAPPVTDALPVDRPSEPTPDVVEPPAIGEPGDLVVRLFGTPGAEGWEQPPQRRDAVELVCLLATRQGRPLRAEEIVVALGAGDLDGSDRSPKTAMNALSALRRSVGAHRLPDASTAGGYRLQHVATDWDVFRALAAAGDEAERSGDHQAAIEQRRRSLMLVRGRPFAGVPEGQYRWAYAEHLVTDMTAAVVDVTHRLATTLLAADRPAEARDAARLGLRGAPDDSVLWEDLARAVEATGEPDAAARFWRSARLALGDPAVTELRSRVGVATDR